MQQPEYRTGCEHGDKPTLFASTRLSEHEGKNNAAERQFLKQPHTDALQRKGGNFARTAGNGCRALRERDDGQIVDRNDERGQGDEERPPPPAHGERLADAHVEGKQ